MADTAGSAPVTVERTLTRRDVHFYVNTLIIELTKKEFQERLREAACDEPVPATGEELLDRFDAVQTQFFAAVPLKVDVASDGATATKCETADVADAAVNTTAPSPDSTAAPAATTVVFCDGASVLAQIKRAAQTFPDPETERVLMRMCNAIETQIVSISASTPQLQHLRSDMSYYGASDASHGHSHANGQPCGHDHGHSHGGAGMRGAGMDGNAMPTPTPEMEQMMAMAMQTLSPKQRETLERVQRTMNSGSPPSADDMREMFLIQQHMMAFMRTMEQFTGAGGRGGRGAAGGRGSR